MVQGFIVEKRLGGRVYLALNQRLKVDLFIATHIAIDHEVVDADFREVAHLVVDPLTSLPSARGGHVLTGCITGLVGKGNIYPITNLIWNDLQEPGMP